MIAWFLYWILNKWQQFQPNMIHPERWFTEGQTSAKLQRWWSHDKFILLRQIPDICAAGHVHAIAHLVDFFFFSFFLTTFIWTRLITSFWSGYRCSSGGSPFLFGLWGQSHCSSQGQPGRRGTLSEQTLALCTGPKASLAILGGDGQHHRNLSFFGGDVFLTD